MRLWLFVARKAKGLTQKDVASAAGISGPVYCGIELGKKNPSVKTAKRIAMVLGFKWTKFFDDEGKEVADDASPEAAEVLQHDGHL